MYVVPVPWENKTSNNLKYVNLPVFAEPDIWYDPTFFDITLNMDESTTRNLTIGNTGLGDLNYSAYVIESLFNESDIQTIPFVAVALGHRPLLPSLPSDVSAPLPLALLPSVSARPPIA